MEAGMRYLVLAFLLLSACAQPLRTPALSPASPASSEGYRGTMCFRDGVGRAWIAEGIFRYDANYNQVEFTHLSISPVPNCIVVE